MPINGNVSKPGGNNNPRKASQIPRYSVANVKPKVDTGLSKLANKQMRIFDNSEAKSAGEANLAGKKGGSTSLSSGSYISTYIAKNNTDNRNKSKIKAPTVIKQTKFTGRGIVPEANPLKIQEKSLVIEDQINLSDVDVNVLMSPKDGNLEDCISRTPFDEPGHELKQEQNEMAIIKEKMLEEDALNNNNCDGMVQSPVLDLLEEEDYMKYTKSKSNPFFDQEREISLEPLSFATKVQGIQSIADITPPKELHEVASDPKLLDNPIIFAELMARESLCDEQPPQLATSSEDLLTQKTPIKDEDKKQDDDSGEVISPTVKSISDDNVQIHSWPHSQDFDTGSSIHRFRGLEITSSFVMEPDTEDEDSIPVAKNSESVSKNGNSFSNLATEEKMEEEKTKCGFEEMRKVFLDDKRTLRQNLLQLETEMLPFMVEGGLRTAACMNGESGMASDLDEILIPKRIRMINTAETPSQYWAHVVIRNTGNKPRIFKIHNEAEPNCHVFRPEYGIVPAFGMGHFNVGTTLQENENTEGKELFNKLQVLIADIKEDLLSELTLQEYWEVIVKGRNKFQVYKIEAAELQNLSESTTNLTQEQIDQILNGSNVDDYFCKASTLMNQDVRRIKSAMSELTIWGTLTIYFSSVAIIGALALKNMDEFLTLDSQGEQVGFFPRIFNSIFKH